MKRNSVIIYRDFMESMKSVPDRSYKRIMNAILSYAMDGIEPNLNGLEKVVFSQAKIWIDANNRKYENGKQGGRPRNQAETETEPSGNQDETEIKPNNNQEITKEEPSQNQTETKQKPKHNLNVKCKVLSDKCIVSKKESKEIYLNNNNIGARESYEEIFNKLSVVDLVRRKMWEFIQHCNLNGKILTNAKLEDILIRLDMAYRSDENLKIECIDSAIRKGYFDVKVA